MTIRQLIKHIQSKIVSAYSKTTGIEYGGEVSLVNPPSLDMGDFSVACFSLAKEAKKSPAQIALELAEAIETDDVISKVQAAGPYVNFTINPQILFGSILTEVEKENENYGSGTLQESQKVMVEYLSPNTNKPLHLGHMRNGALGMAISKIYEKAGHEVIKACLINDRGIHICKSMLAWKKWGGGETPKDAGMKGDHFVGKWYVRYAQELETDPSLAEQAQEMLQKWETGDAETLELWKMMNEWVYEGYNQTFQKLGLEFDKTYYESQTYKLGKDIVQEGLAKEIFRKTDEGAVVFDLPEDEFGLDKDGQKKSATVLRADGTSVYLTQDLGTALLKVKEFGLDESVYVVGSEQTHHFKVLFKILETLGYPWAKKLHHLSYAMVYLPDGKMKSREGKIVDADDLAAEMEKVAEEEIRNRDEQKKLSDEEVKERAGKIGLAAIKFYLLRVHANQDIHFDPKESISFDGFTGPYCQYAWARIAGIIRNAKEQGITESGEVEFSLLGKDEERLLVHKIMQFPQKIQTSLDQFDPMDIAVYAYELAKSFNQFYNKHQVVGEDKPLSSARLSLVKSTSIVLKNALGLLGVEVMERM